MAKTPFLHALGFAVVLTSVRAADPTPENPFFSESTLPFHYPPFDRIRQSDYVPAFERGMAEQLREVDAIASNTDKPTFENTIVAMEKSGQLLRRVRDVFSNIKTLESDEAMKAIDREMTPRLSGHDDAIHLNTALFARIHKLFTERAALGLDAESLRLLERYHDDFVRSGAELSGTDQARLRSLNSEISSLVTAFAQNVLRERNASSVLVHDKAELAGLTDAEIAALAAAATADGKPGEYEIRLVNTTGQSALTSLQNRALRQRLMEASEARGSRGGPYDNQSTVERIARLRAERANLLGFATHADYVVADQTARTEPAIEDLLAKLMPASVAKARSEAAAMQAIIDRENGGFRVASWDWDFYSEKVRREKYAFDQAQIKPYLELNRVLKDGVFFAANRLYGLTFKERHDLPVYNPDVRVFEVFDADGKHLGILLEDFYARPSKQGGAWMNSYVLQSRLLGTQPIVANHHNIQKPQPGEPTLLTFDEVTTLFHEFGHGLHGLFSNVEYPRFGGTSVPRDFVEYPSQVNEMWAAWPEVVRNYAKNYMSGEPMPQALLDKVLAAQKFNQGFKTTEYLKATILDQAWYNLKPDMIPTDVKAFEAATFKRYGADFEPVPPRYHSDYFSHVFAGGYSANYYSYIWADVIVADSTEWFAGHGGLTRANGDHFRTTVLSQGGSREAMSLFHDFTGGEPDVAPLLRRRGLDEPGN
jgi:peptidyl-dipeptidase Dcp